MPLWRWLALLGSLPVSALFSAQALPVIGTDPNILSYPALLPERSQSATPLLVSNSPETVRSPGLLYRDAVTGAARVLAYHLNALPGDQPARLLIGARNPSALPLSLTLTRRGAALSRGPDPLIGQETLLRFFASGPQAERTLEPGEALTLYDSGPLRPGQVVSVLLDLVASGEVQLSVYLLRGPERPGPDTRALDADGLHQRGTFPGAERTWRLRLPPAPLHTPFRVVFSDQADLPLTGTDALTGRPQVLKGNFGVLYDLTLEGTAGTLLAASARGGAYRGALTLQDGTRRTPLLIGRGQALIDGAFPEPLWRVRSDTLRVGFVPANGSNLPLALVLYPPGFPQPPVGPTPTPGR
ncbi:hypothetical protein [Deinococcus sp.]|uniref:hypothetical protein n=1 Tax=Deinococcus sp. TaxID=47478 RepID=UPI003C7D5A96